MTAAQFELIDETEAEAILRFHGRQPCRDYIRSGYSINGYIGQWTDRAAIGSSKPAS